MRRSHRSALVGAGPLLVLAVACHWGLDLPTSDAPQLQLIEGPIDSIRTGMYAGMLRDMHEPTLDRSRAPVGMTVLRMIWVRPFDPPSAVRMVETPGHCVVVVAITGMPQHRYGPRGSDSVWHDETATRAGPRPILRHDSNEVAPDKCAAVRGAAIAARLWSGPVSGGQMVNDGDDVAFEIVDTAGHRFATRWTPGPGHSPEFREVAHGFIFVGKLDPRMHSMEGHWSPWADW